jgi:hypothetical protein
VEPIEAYLRRETGAYLDPCHDRLKTAYVTVRHQSPQITVALGPLVLARHRGEHIRHE